MKRVDCRLTLEEADILRKMIDKFWPMNVCFSRKEANAYHTLCSEYVECVDDKDE